MNHRTVVSPRKKQTITQTSTTRRAAKWAQAFIRRNWFAFTIITIATAIFFAPILPRLSSYSEGGDTMFNAWTLARNHHCLLRHGCQSYANANIYYPHKDTMLYSETQLSAGVLTLPLYAINKNPLFAYNVWTILSFMFSGFFMYLLARHINGRGGLVPILSGLIFEFGPTRITSVTHLQNLSIFYLPLIVLFILKYYERRHNKYLVGLFFALLLQFYASWYQMVFVLFGLAGLLGCHFFFKLKSLRQLLPIVATVFLAILCTLPLAREYVRFSKSNKAAFGIQDQVMYSSSLADYLAPPPDSLVGKLAKEIAPNSKIHNYNIDGRSFASFTLYITALTILVLSYRKRRTKKYELLFKHVVSYAFVGLIGIIVSLGPLLKVYGTAKYADLANGLSLVIPMPYYLIDRLLPQLSFIRAIGRASVLLLFALCCILAYLNQILASYLTNDSQRRIVRWFVAVMIAIELLPLGMYSMRPAHYHYNLQVPGVYKFIANRDEVNNIIIIATNGDYPDAKIPFARAEQVLWAGYHNKNIFNGYSGYTPPEYERQLEDFTNYQADDRQELLANNIHYLLLDKRLSTSTPSMRNTIIQNSENITYEDTYYMLVKL